MAFPSRGLVVGRIVCGGTQRSQQFAPDRNHFDKRPACDTMNGRGITRISLLWRAELRCRETENLCE